MDGDETKEYKKGRKKKFYEEMMKNNKKLANEIKAVKLKKEEAKIQKENMKKTIWRTIKIN